MKRCIKYILVLIMNIITRFRRKINNYLYDHIHLKNTLSFTKGFFVAAMTAALYAFAFYCFITPAVEDHATLSGSSVITGGVGGITQVLYSVIVLAGGKVDPFLLQSICYFAFNIPILAFAYFKIGKKFAILTLVNVGLSSLFIQLFDNIQITKDIANAIKDEHLARVIFAGICIGGASAFAFKGEISCGGIDVISYYFALRKSTSVGKYTTGLNSVIIMTFSLLSLGINKGIHGEVAILNFMYGVLYLFVVMLVVDFINIRNKKVQVQIVTSYPEISSILISNFPHSTTSVKALGGYSKAEKAIIYMVVSSNETKRVVDLVRKIDPHSFITVTSLVQAYGNFFIKPVE